ncbi:hypothetical protein [Pseudorhodobacter sp.]|uniref:hypothetical protein n=1 Tax=Pseudorhodobacter sp. TaxID=1934400 RepID=UPI002AFFB4B2|nr:hypothetical protein [Pseudorhodobacter sp.]
MANQFIGRDWVAGNGRAGINADAKSMGVKGHIEKLSTRSSCGSIKQLGATFKKPTGLVVSVQGAAAAQDEVSDAGIKKGIGRECGNGICGAEKKYGLEQYGLEQGRDIHFSPVA